MRTLFFILAAINIAIAALLWPSAEKERADGPALARMAPIGNLRLIGEGPSASDLKALSPTAAPLASGSPSSSLSTLDQSQAQSDSETSEAPIACLEWSGLTEADRLLIEPALTKGQPMRLASEREPERARFWVTLRQSSVSQAQLKLEGLEKLGEAPGWRLWGASVRGGPYESETLARAEAQRVESKGAGVASIEKDAQPLWSARFGPWPSELKTKLKELEKDIPGSKIAPCSDLSLARWELALAKQAIKKEAPR